MYKEINSYELIELMSTHNINLIDIRDNYQFSLGSISGAKNIPTNYLLTNPSKYLNKKDDYYLFCNYGTTSSKICNILTKQGYNVVNVAGGYANYLEDSR